MNEAPIRVVPRTATATATATAASNGVGQGAGRRLKLNVLRHNPHQPGSVPHWQTYEIEEADGMTLFIALSEIREKLDPSLQFDFVCRAGICGSCAMVIDGKPALACRTLTKNLGAEVTLAPLPFFELIGDLSVNTGKWMRGMSERLEGWLHMVDPRPDITRIEQRIATLLRWPVSHGEGIQVLRYRPGAEYLPHFDYFDPVHPGSMPVLARGGQRVGTLVMYLSAPVRGGATTFPAVGLEVAPVPGSAVFFSYDRPDASTGTLHGGAPVLEGEKWVATKWLREGEFK
jgi:hypothetical protein